MHPGIPPYPQQCLRRDTQPLLWPLLLHTRMRVACLCAQVFSAAAGLLLSAAGVLPLSRGPPTSPRELMPALLLAGCTAGTMFLGNAPYMHLSLSFIQILKAFTPALTLVVGTLAGIERLTGALVLSVLLIAVGTG